MQPSTLQPASRGPGRPKMAEHSEQVSVRYPQRVLDAVNEIVEERGGKDVVDRVAVLREATVKGLEIMRKGRRG